MNVSVVIPARDAERYLGEAIRSACSQSQPPHEVIVVDDGSADRTADVAASFGSAVDAVTIPSAGAGAARNAGVERATGDAIAFLDADDLWLPDKLERQLGALETHDLVFGLLDEFVSPELDSTGLSARTGLFPGHVASTLLARRDSFERVGAFATHLEIGEFVDWIARAKGLGLRETTVPHHVASRRVHASNTTRTRRASLTDLASPLKASLDRRRLEGTA